jgi:hypothetical protein
LFGRFSQVSSVPATAEFYDVVSSITSQLNPTTISGTTLSFSLTTSNYSSISTGSFGTDRSTRYDIPTPFPIRFLDTSTTKLYVHASGFIAADTSVASNANTQSSFRPFQNVRYVGVLPSHGNNLHSVHYGTQGSAPNRYFTIHYNGDYGRASTGTLAYLAGSYSYQDVAAGVTGGQTTGMVTRGAAIGGASTTPTSGTATNGYYRFTLPWSIWLGGSSQTEVYLANNGIVSFGNWIDDLGNPITAPLIRLGGATVPLLEQFHLGEGGSDDTTASFPAQVNRTYNGVLGTAPNRSYLIRFEGDWHSTVTVAAGSSRYIYELEFKESNLSSVLVHFGHVAVTSLITTFHMSRQSTTFYYHVRNLENIAGIPSRDMQYNSVQRITSAISLEGYYTDVAVTSGVVNYNFSTPTATVIQHLRYSNPRTPQKWEMSFPENSASPFILRTGRLSNRSLGDYAARQNYYDYRLDAGQIYSNSVWEWSEGTLGSNDTLSSMVTISFATGPLLSGVQDSSTLTAVFSKFGSSAALSAVIPSTTSNNLLLLQAWNATSTTPGDQSPPNSAIQNYLIVDYGVGHTTANTEFFWSGNGVIYRYPQDGFNATASNLNPNPTLGSSLSNTYYLASITQSGGGSGWWGGPPSPVTFTYYYDTSLGVLFSYGSSAATHSRFLQTTPTQGRTHILRVEGHVGRGGSSLSIGYNNLAPVQSGQDLEAWYSKDPNIQPPTAGQTPSTLGWIRAGVLASSADGGAAGGSAFNRFWQVITAELSSTVTWLIWQKSFTSQTSASQRLSEYLLTDISVQSINDTNVPRANSRFVLGSGSVVRITSPTNKNRTTFTTDLYYVAEDPRRRRIRGDQFLILRPVDTVTSMPYLSSINSWSIGGTTSYALNNIALNNIGVSFIETRNIASITNQTTLSVTAAWSSTSNRLWGFGSGLSVARRSFAIDTVLTDTSLTLRNPANNVRFNLPIAESISTTSVVADRRFTVVAVNSDTDVQVSGGGIYANITDKQATFAAPKPVTIDGQTGYLLQGFNENIVNTSLNTRWTTDGLPGTDDRGEAYGTRLDDLTITVGYLEDNDGDGIVETLNEVSSFTVLRIFNNSSILVTGSIITYNFLNNSMVTRFPANSSEITLTGTDTAFVASSVTVSSATQTFEQVTEFDFSDRRTGYLLTNGGQFLRVISIVNDNTLIVSSLAIRAPIVSSTATSFRRTRGFAPPRALGRPGGATFDKVGGSITNDESLIVQDPNIDYTQIKELYHNSSNLTLGTSTTLLSTSVSIGAGSSILLMVTWTKDLADSADEVLNQLQVTVSSAGTFVAKFDDETQRNHKDIAVAQSQLYRGSVYLNSSNSISSVTGVISGDTVSSVTWLWTPYNVKRAGTYSRLSAIVDSSTETSISITVETGPTETWQSLATDFLNITVIGTS